MLVAVGFVTVIGVNNLKALQRDADLIVTNHMAKIQHATSKSQPRIALQSASALSGPVPGQCLDGRIRLFS